MDKARGENFARRAMIKCAGGLIVWMQGKGHQSIYEYLRPTSNTVPRLANPSPPGGVASRPCFVADSVTHPIRCAPSSSPRLGGLLKPQSPAGIREQTLMILAVCAPAEDAPVMTSAGVKDSDPAYPGFIEFMCKKLKEEPIINVSK